MAKAQSAISLSSQKLEEILFFLLALFLPTQLGIHLWPEWSIISGIRIDYLAPTFFLTDLLVFALFAEVLISKKIRFSAKEICFAIIIFLLAVINTLYSASPEVSVYRWLKVGEFSFLAYYVFRFKDFVKGRIAIPLLIGAFVNLILGVSQIINGATVGGLFRFLGERTFNTGTPGIALVSLFGRETLRAYGTFSHPNVFGGFGVVASVLIFLFGKERRIQFLGIILGMALSLVSFSKSAIIAEGLVLILLTTQIHKHLSHFFKKALIGLVIISILTMPAAKLFLESGRVAIESIIQRVELTNYAGRIFSQNPSLGTGLGTFIPEVAKFQGSGVKLLQPVHNIFLLVLVETGFVGLGFFVLLLSKLKTTKFNEGILILVPILTTGMVDHYWLTLQQPALLFAIVIGILL